VITVRRSQERGRSTHGWLDSFHTFAFADYFDPAHLGYGVLRVINEDRIQPGRGFGTHAHQAMEILSYVLEGALAHRDSLGNGSVIRAGDVQRLSAGTGVQHSEFNPSSSELVHFLQIWIVPGEAGLPPSYAQKHFPEAEKRGRWRLIASPDGGEGSLSLHQEAFVCATLLPPGQALVYPLAPHRKGYLQVMRGHLHLNGQALAPGDGARLSEGEVITIAADRLAEALLFDLP
jgi:redox-sensitive bicupin YhaK (pirin superfamily)